MKRLIILRHAKSDWGKEGLKDIDRHLNNRGYEDAYSQSAWLAAHQERPNQILSSSATRALSTALIFARTLEIDMSNFKVEPAIYEAPIESLLEILGRQDNRVDSILLAGHNPGLTELCHTLSEDVFFDNLPTCALVAFEGDCKTWAKFVERKMPIKFYKFPKD
jgi:phosphohistidine phosphatase